MKKIRLKRYTQHNKSLISVAIKDFYIIIIGHCFTTYPKSGCRFTTYLGHKVFKVCIYVVMLSKIILILCKRYITCIELFETVVH